ncbi:MAG: FtsQ-type POTRA domain-containing protein [Calditrichaeota bacterium]|nr:MAG: FtsQ-type POTRA domain-containing protein [Calditrichota bacterium]
MKVYSKYRNHSNYFYQSYSNANIRTRILVLLFIVFILLMLLKITTWVGAEEIFQLKTIKIEGNRLISQSELKSLIKIDSSLSLLKIDLQSIERQIRKHPLIKEVTVSRLLPSTLKIKVKEREPLALLNQGVLVAVDEYGSILPEINTTLLCDYPVISSIQINNPDQGVSDKLKTILKFLAYLKREHFTIYCQISEISLSRDGMVFFYLTDSAIPVIVGQEIYGDWCKRLKRTLDFLHKTDGLQNVKYIDLRFANQVVIKEKTTS